MAQCSYPSNSVKKCTADPKRSTKFVVLSVIYKTFSQTADKHRFTNKTTNTLQTSSQPHNNEKGLQLHTHTRRNPHHRRKTHCQIYKSNPTQWNSSALEREREKKKEAALLEKKKCNRPAHTARSGPAGRRGGAEGGGSARDHAKYLGARARAHTMGATRQLLPRVLGRARTPSMCTPTPRPPWNKQ